jgi:hypothetical protein
MGQILHVAFLDLYNNYKDRDTHNVTFSFMAILGSSSGTDVKIIIQP